MRMIGAALEPLRSDPSGSAVIVDFDGTLAPIVVDPRAARPLPGVGEVLLALARRYARVAVVSGRPLAYLGAHLPASIDVAGLYGLEERRSGELVEHPLAATWRPVIDETAAAALDQLPEGVEVEHKGLSLTLHTRRHPERAEQAAAWAATMGAATGLDVRGGKQSVELHPPIDVDKGTVVSGLVAGLRAACFLGDDLGDLPAFAALDRFAAGGGAAVRIAVASAEAPPELLAAADLQVDGPQGALELLQALAVPSG